MKFGIDIRRKVYKKIIDGLGGLRFVISGSITTFDFEVVPDVNTSTANALSSIMQSIYSLYPSFILSFPI